MSNNIPPPSSLATDAEAIIARAIEAHAGIPLSQMTPQQVVAAVVASSSDPVAASPPAAPTVPASLSAVLPGVSTLVAGVSTDPLLQDRQVRGFATAEIQRLDVLLRTPGSLTVNQLLKGALATQ